MVNRPDLTSPDVHVLATREQNLAHDSYFYVTAWDGATVQTWEYASTAYASDTRRLPVTTDPRAMRAAAESLRRTLMRAELRSAAWQMCTLERGMQVRVARGRKVPIGTTGTIAWIGPGKHGYRPRARVGLDVTGAERVWIDARNLDPLAFGPDAIDHDALIERVERTVAKLASGDGWSAYSHGLAFLLGDPDGRHDCIHEDARDRFMRLMPA